MARVWVKTYGCSRNVADSERMAGMLQAAGHILVEREQDADLVLVNSCAVKTPAEQRFRNDIARAKKAGKQVVVAGCVVQGSPRDAELLGYSAVGVRNLEDVVPVVEGTLEGGIVRKLVRKGNSRLIVPKVRRNPLVEIVPINTGCLGSCTYCKTVHARGRLTSYPMAEIIDTIETAVDQGAKEVWLTSEDVGAYGRDIGTDIARLLERIAQLRGSFMVRIGMANPPFIKEHAATIKKIIDDHPDRFYRFLHIPVQSGSNDVLEQMNREYREEDFIETVEAVPGMTIATDFIVGFPGETEEDHAKTMALLQKYRCRVANINRFYPRPGTVAAKRKLLPTKIVARRCRELVALFDSYDLNEGAVGTTVDVLFTGKGKSDSLIGRTREYVQVVVHEDVPLGKWVPIKVVEEKKHYLVGQMFK